MGVFDFYKIETAKRMIPEGYFQVTITNEGVMVEPPKRTKGTSKMDRYCMYKNYYDQSRAFFSLMSGWRY